MMIATIKEAVGAESEAKDTSKVLIKIKQLNDYDDDDEIYYQVRNFLICKFFQFFTKFYLKFLNFYPK